MARAIPSHKALGSKKSMKFLYLLIPVPRNSWSETIDVLKISNLSGVSRTPLTTVIAIAARLKLGVN